MIQADEGHVQQDLCDLSVSTVLFNPDIGLLDVTFSSLSAALRQISSERAQKGFEFVVVDNGGGGAARAQLASLRLPELRVRVLAGHGNVGYGRGHNLAIDTVSSRYHLVLNPDIDLDASALDTALAFMDAHPEVGLLTPWIGGEDGAQQYLSRRFPSILDLFARGFLPARARRPFARRLAHYEMRDLIAEGDIVWDPPIVSGCFMLFRTEVLKKLNGFDPRYFLYFEDYDLSLRTHEIARVAYVPSVRVLHHGGDAARKGGTHIKLFITSAFKFFNRFGWKWL